MDLDNLVPVTSHTSYILVTSTIFSSPCQISHSLGISISVVSKVNSDIILTASCMNSVSSLGLCLCQTHVWNSVELKPHRNKKIHGVKVYIFLASIMSTTWVILPHLTSNLKWTLPCLDYNCSRFFNMKFLLVTRNHFAYSFQNRRLTQQERIILLRYLH